MEQLKGRLGFEPRFIATHEDYHTVFDKSRLSIIAFVSRLRIEIDFFR